MSDLRCPCVFPSPSEEELITLPGIEPGTAIRAYVESGPGGYVRLQQLAHDPGLGWYVQKSFVIPGEMLAALLPQLRKADCLIPRGGPRRSIDPDCVMRLTGEWPADQPTAMRRRA